MAFEFSSCRLNCHSGQVKAGSGFEYWLMKFDGVSGNKDKGLDDPKGYGAIEYAYYRRLIPSQLIPAHGLQMLLPGA